MRKFYPTIAETFEAKHMPVPHSGCWIWIGKLNAQGYGTLSRKGANGKQKIMRAHVVAYRMLVGEVPEGLELDHLCKVRSCVNPDHLEPVTHQVNCQRGEAGHHRAIECSALTHCKNGHEWTEANTYYRPNTQGKVWRSCRTCMREWVRRRRT